MIEEKMRQHHPSTAERNIFFGAIWFLICLADQMSKLWIRSNLALGESIPPTGFFRLTYVQNTGAAFSLFQGNNAALAAIVVLEGLAVIVFFFFILRRFPQWDTRLSTVSLALILGGITGNLIDRIHLGYVTDFIDIGPWPVFNIADSAGVVGIIMLALIIITSSRDTGTEKP
jgi:signal peptidase II